MFLLISSMKNPEFEEGGPVVSQKQKPGFNLLQRAEPRQVHFHRKQGPSKIVRWLHEIAVIGQLAYGDPQGPSWEPQKKKR